MSSSDGIWSVIYVIGGTAAAAAVLVFQCYFSVELMQFNGFDLVTVPDFWPSSAAEWFALFAQNRIVAMVLFDLFFLVNYALVSLIFLALYGALRKVARRLMKGAAAIGFAAAGTYFLSNQLFNMLQLNGRFAAASTAAERVAALSEAEARLALHNPGELYAGPDIFISLFLLMAG